VAAHVVKGAHSPAAVPEDNDALRSHLLEDIVSLVGDLILPPHAEPALGKDPLEFLGKYFWSHVIAPGQGPSAINGNLRGLQKLAHRGLNRLDCLKYGARPTAKEGRDDGDYGFQVMYTVDGRRLEA